MNAYARSLPTLGFDPAPGNVDLTRSLAQRHAQVAQEARQVLAIVEKLDLSALQGRTADALRAIQGTFPPALQGAASGADTLQAAASSWANQLSGFQAEAAALERQAAATAAHQQALQTQQAALPPGSTVLTADIQTASTTMTGVQRQAQELHQRYLAAAAKTAADVSDHKSLWEGTEPVRKVLEAVLAPLDIVAADHWVSTLKEIAGVPSEWVAQVDEKINEVNKLIRAGKSPIEELISAGKLAESTGTKIDGWYAFAPNWLKTAAGAIAGIKGVSYTLSGLGLVADVGTLITPQNEGTLGWVDRGVAGVNAGLIAADVALGGIPVVGEVALFGTGLYLAGDYFYQHWTAFRNVANDVGHATVTVADDIGHGTVQGAEEIGHGAVKAADTLGHAASSTWHAVTSFGGWL